MWMVIIALIPVTLASIYFFGLRVLAMIAVSYVAGGAVEVIISIIRKEEIDEGFLVTGLLFPLILPPALPLWMVAAGIVFGVLVGKELFGGTGRNVFNPALVGRCFLTIGYPAALASNWITPGTGLTGRFLQYVDASHLDAVTSATPLVMAKRGDLVELSSLFFGNVSGCAGETSAILVIIGGLFLILTRIASWRTVVAVLVSFVLFEVALHQYNPERYVGALPHLFAGGLLFGAFFMATDPVTSPVTNGGKWMFGIIIGVTTVLIRNFTGFVEGVMFAILLGNIAAPVLDEVIVRKRIWRLKDER
jgi:Na(+)-translocating NADH:ubiquinone oxidoreductase B subunit